MKVGSLVELVNDNWQDPPMPGEIYPIKGKIYTVRTIEKECDNNYYIRLEEVVNPSYKYKDDEGECSFNIKKFRELLPPLDIASEIEKQSELVTT